MPYKPYRQPPPSPIEVAFWETASPLIPELQREVWIDKKYRVDFLVPSKKIVIELYGYEYHKDKRKLTQDAQRERYLQKRGYQVLRFTGSEVYKDVTQCVDEVIAIIKAHLDNGATQGSVKKLKAPAPEKVRISLPKHSAVKSDEPAKPTIAINHAGSLQALDAVPVSQPQKPDVVTLRQKRIWGMKMWQVAVLGGMLLVIIATFVILAVLIFSSGGV